MRRGNKIKYDEGVEGNGVPLERAELVGSRGLLGKKSKDYSMQRPKK